MGAYQMYLPNSRCRKFKDIYSGSKLLLISLTVSVEQGVYINCPKPLGSSCYTVKTSAAIQGTGKKRSLKSTQISISRSRTVRHILGEV